MKYLTIPPVIIGVFFVMSGVSTAAEVYRWVDKNGNVFFSDSPPPDGNFDKRMMKNEVDNTPDQIRQLKKQRDIEEDNRFKQRLDAEVDYQRRTKKARDQKEMGMELQALREKYQKKLNHLYEKRKNEFHGSSSRHDIDNEITALKKQQAKEEKDIRALYGY